MSAVHTDSADRLRHPGRIPSEDGVVLRRTCKLHAAQLHDKLVDDLLDLLLCERSFLEIALRIDVEECGGTSKAHCRTVLLLDCCKVGKIYRLRRFQHVVRRLGNVTAVNLCKLFQHLECADLLGKLLTLTDDIRVHDRTGRCELFFLVLDQAIHTVECRSSVIADNTSAAICIRKSRDDVCRTACAHLRCVSIKYTGVVCLSVRGKIFHHFRIYMVAVILAGFHCHADSAVRLQGTLERLICLKADNLLLALVQIARSVGCDRGDNLGIHIEDTACLTLLLRQF